MEGCAMSRNIFNFTTKIYFVKLAHNPAAFADSIPLPDWYLSYAREGIDQVDSDFEAVETEDEDRIKFYVEP